MHLGEYIRDKTICTFFLYHRRLYISFLILVIPIFFITFLSFLFNFRFKKQIVNHTDVIMVEYLDITFSSPANGGNNQTILGNPSTTTSLQGVAQ
jgi:hypothetical protein